MAFIDFNVEQEQDLKPSFAALPAGEYVAIATESSLTKNKAGNGDYFKFTFEIIDGPFKSRKIWHNFTRTSQNNVAQQIGRSQFKQFCESVKNLSPKDTSELHNKPFILTLKKVKDETYGDDDGYKNEVHSNKGFKVYGGKVESTPKTTADDIPW